MESLTEMMSICSRRAPTRVLIEAAFLVFLPSIQREHWRIWHPFHKDPDVEVPRCLPKDRSCYSFQVGHINFDSHRGPIATPNPFSLSSRL